MSTVERYLASVAWHLPAASRSDIVSELRDDILSRIEAVEEASGRPADEVQIAAILQATGHPARIAARYSAQPGLVPPEAVPWWWAHVRALGALIAVLSAAGALLAILSGQQPARAVIQAAVQGAQNFLIWLGVLTLAYLAVVRHLYPRMLDSWTPSQLVAETPDKGTPTLVHAIGLVFGVAFLLWWTGAVEVPATHGVAAGAVWAQLYWPVLIVAVLGIARSLAEMWLPAHRRLLAALALMIAVGGIAIASHALRNGPLAVATDVDAAVPGMIAGINAVGPIVLVVIVIANLFEGWRSARVMLGGRAVPR